VTPLHAQRIQCGVHSIEESSCSRYACLSLFSSSRFRSTIVVTSDSDLDDTTDPPNGVCTLREAINNGDNHGQPDPDCETGGQVFTTIVFGRTREGSPISRVTINPKFGELSVNALVTINGPVTIANLKSGGTSRLLHVTSGQTSLVLDHVSLDGGVQRGASGGALLNEGSLSMLGGTITNSRADHGGAMALYGDSQVRGVEFFANEADVDGGAVWNASSGKLEMADCSVHDNRTNNGPGSAFFSGIANPNITIERTAFYDNRATGTLGDGTFYGGGEITIKNSSFVLNAVEGDNGGAGIFLTNTANATLIDVEIASNTLTQLRAGASGGGLFADGATVNMTRSSIIGNKAWAGGGIYAAPGSDLQITNTTIARNVADLSAANIRADAGDGSAVFMRDGIVALIGTTIRDNVGRSQLASKGPNAIMSVDNSIVWGTDSKYNCFGGGFVTMVDGSLQGQDIGSGSCPFPSVTVMDSTLFSGPMTFVDPVSPPSLPLEHVIWVPAAGSPLLGGGFDDFCDDPLLQNDEDEVGAARSECDIGAVEGF
jgi:CSLREA domain-containing protein